MCDTQHFKQFASLPWESNIHGHFLILKRFTFATQQFILRCFASQRDLFPKTKKPPNSFTSVTQVFSEEALEKSLSSRLHWHLRLPFRRKTKSMSQNTDLPHSQVGRGESNVSLWGWIKKKKKPKQKTKLKAVTWSFSTGFTSHRKITLFLKQWKQIVLGFWKWTEAILILFPNFKWCSSDSISSTSWEKFKMRAEGSYSPRPGEGAAVDTWAP